MAEITPESLVPVGFAPVQPGSADEGLAKVRLYMPLRNAQTFSVGDPVRTVADCVAAREGARHGTVERAHAHEADGIQARSFEVRCPGHNYMHDKIHHLAEQELEPLSVDYVMTHEEVVVGRALLDATQAFVADSLALRCPHGHVVRESKAEEQALCHECSAPVAVGARVLKCNEECTYVRCCHLDVVAHAVLKDPKHKMSVSRQHLKIRWNGKTKVLDVEVGGRNGAVVNGEFCEAPKPGDKKSIVKALHKRKASTVMLGKSNGVMLHIAPSICKKDTRPSTAGGADTRPGPASDARPSGVGTS